MTTANQVNAKYPPFRTLASVHFAFLLKLNYDIACIHIRKAMFLCQWSCGVEAGRPDIPDRDSDDRNGEFIFELPASIF